MSALDRVGAFSGAAFLILGNLGTLVNQTQGVPDNATGQDILDWNARLSTSVSAQIGLSLELLAFTGLLVFVAYVYTRGREAGWLAVAGVVGGATAIAVKLASVGSDLAIYILRDSMDPDTALALAKMSLVSFMIFTMPFGLFLLCGAAAAMITYRINRVIGWAGVVIGAASILYVVVMGPRIDSGFSPTFLLAMLWMLVASLVWGFSRSDRKTPSRVDNLARN
jgi:hypothetical protein